MTEYTPFETYKTEYCNNCHASNCNKDLDTVYKCATVRLLLNELKNKGG